MDLPLSFQARLQDIEDTKRQLLEQLQLQDELQEVEVLNKFSVDEEIVTQEKIRDELQRSLGKLEAHIERNKSTKMMLKQQQGRPILLQEKRVAADNCMNQVVMLEMGNQILEQKVYEAIQIRDQRKRELEDIESRITERTKLIHR
eukprot:c19571_g1_i3 orf=268-705(+)